MIEEGSYYFANLKVAVADLMAADFIHTTRPSPASCCRWMNLLQMLNLSHAKSISTKIFTARSHKHTSAHISSHQLLRNLVQICSI